MRVHLYACDTDDVLYMKADEPNYQQEWGDREPKLFTTCPHSRGDIVLDHRVRYVGAFSLARVGGGK